MNYKKKQNNNKIGKEIFNKSRTLKDNDSSNSFIKNNHFFEYLSLSFKSDEEQNNIQDRKSKKNDIIDNSLASKTKINYNKIYDNKYFQDLADKLYNSDEHFNKKKKIQRKNISLHNVISLNELLFSNSNLNKKTSITKKERAKKKKRKSLFPAPDKLNKKEEEDGITIKNFRKSIPPKSQLGENKSKHKGSNFGSFLRLNQKNKYPVKDSYIDSILKRSANSKAFSNIRNNNENKEQSIRSIKTNKKNLINSEKNETKMEEEKEIPFLDKSNLSQKDINGEQKKLNKKKNKWKPIKFCCCLSSGCIC